MLLIAAALALLWQPAAAVFADEAYTIDYHYALLGAPQSSTTFFHRPNPDSRASLIYTLSEQNVIGALNPKDGAVVWRQLLQANSTQGYLRASDGADLVVSGIGHEVVARSAEDGKLAWTHTAAGTIRDIEILDYETGKDTIALSDDAVVRLDEATGTEKWKYALDGSDAVYQVSLSARTTYIVLLHKTILGYYKIRVVSLDPATGKKEDDYTLSSENELASMDTILTVGANTASPIVAWTDAAYSVLKVNVLGSKNIASFSIKGSVPVKSVVLHAPTRVNSLPHFLAHFQGEDSSWAEVYHIDIKSGKVDKAYNLPANKEPSTFSTSTIGSNVYFTRISTTEIMTVSSSSHGILGRWPVAKLSDKGPKQYSYPLFASTELSVKGGSVSAVRSAVWLASGELVLLRDGVPQWTRPEILADTVNAEFQLPAVAEALARSTPEQTSNPVAGFAARLQRHVDSLTSFFATGGLVNYIRGLAGLDTDLSSAFGFDQSILCTTSKGWTILLEAGSAGDVKSISPPGVDHSEGLAVAPSAFQYKQVGNEIHGSTNGEQIWTFTPKSEERILSISARPEDDPVASIGVVLGNRDVLYKYLNPNLALVTTASDSAKTVSFHIIDTVSGGVLYASTHTDIDLSMPVTSTVSENWFAFSYTADSSATSPKGHFLVGGELYESLSSNDRGLLDAATNYSSLAASDRPYVLTQTFHIAEPISKMAVTSTRQGITTKQLLVVLPDSNSVVGIPRMVIDPRRPNRDPTKDEQMEGLVKYSPNLELDPKWHLNHKREVLGVKDVLTSPALLESTSLIFAYGLDVFGTRLSPSFNFDMLGKDFNKFQMLSTVAALFVATVVVGPLVSYGEPD